MNDGVLNLDTLMSTIRTFRREFAPIEPNAGHIIESIHMVDGPFEDWSRVRSPGRARRRRLKGYRQNIRLYTTPKRDFMKLPDGTLVGHPQTVRAFYAMIKDRIDSKRDDYTRQAFYGTRG